MYMSDHIRLSKAEGEILHIWEAFTDENLKEIIQDKINLSDKVFPKIKNLSKSFGYLIKKLFFEYVFLVNNLLNSLKESSDICSNLLRISLISFIK